MIDTLPIHDELISPTAIQVGQKLTLTVPRPFTGRRIYLFLDTKTTGDFTLFTAVKTYNEGTPVDYFRSDLFSNTNGLVLNKSLISHFAVGGSAVGDSIVLQLTAPFNAAIPTVVMQPLRIDSRIDKVQWEIESLSGLIQGIRAWLGCVSTNPNP